MLPRTWLPPLAAVLVTLPVSALHQSPPPRTHLTFHAYVDPTMGDDVVAAVLNPGWGNSTVPFTWHPDPSVIPPGDMADFRTNKHVGGILCQAPYPFRTIQAAIAYVCTQGPNDSVQNNWMLGALVDPVTQSRITWIIIHCLPGLYGGTYTTNTIDPKTGLPWNKEGYFPIELPYGISLQGASALDTIIDAGNNPTGTRTHAIEIVEPGMTTSLNPNANRDYIKWNPLRTNDLGEITHPIAGLARTFIDGFTVRGAAVFPDPAAIIAPRYTRGAGIAMLRQRTNGWSWGEEDPAALALAPTISNCFINHCGVGIAVIALEELSLLRTWRPLIVNNTLADNTYVDIYNGSSAFGGTSQPSFGRNQLRVVNNICMRSLGMSPFHPFTGMHEADLRVVLPSAPYSFNAYANVLVTSVPNFPPGSDWTTEWPASYVDTSRTGVPPVATPLPPVVDLVALNSDAFLINRVFANTWRGPVSQHDYRLAPWSHAVFDPQQDPTGMHNPMVNVGVTLRPQTNDMLFANRLLINDTSQSAGLPISASDAYNHSEHPAPMPIEPFQLFDAWDTDCDGFANPRVYNRAGFPNNGFGGIDLGADELGDLVMSGYVDDTRMFDRVTASPPAPAVSPMLTRPQIFFFNVPGQGPFPRPQFNAVFGGMHWSTANVDWFLNAQTNPVANPTNPANYTNYCLGDMALPLALPPTPPYWVGSWRSAMLTWPPLPSRVQKDDPSFQFPSLRGACLLPRSFMCDFSPLLPPDIHPLWGSLGSLTTAAPSGCPSLVPANPPLLAPWPSDLYAANPWYRDQNNYIQQRQPADFSSTPSCDLTIGIDNAYAYYNPSNGVVGGLDPGYPRTSAQRPTRLSNPTSGIINPPGTLLDMNVVGGAGNIAPRLDVFTFGNFLFGPFTPCTNLSSTTYDVDQQGIGDSAAGCPDEVPNLYQGVGIRINCMLGVGPSGVGTSNLQTFLVYSRTIQGLMQSLPSQTSVQSPAASRLCPPTPKDLRAGVQRLLDQTSGGR